MALEGKQFSHYRLLQIIGSGGTGKVYLAEDIYIHRRVAVKIIELGAAPERDEATTSTLRHFLHEATAIAKLDHPHILPLYDYGEARLEGSHFVYLVTPYRAEGSLITWLYTRSQAQQTSPLLLKQVTHIIQQAASALQYAHEHQVMHLDVKPANFLIHSQTEADAYPDLLLADFGISRLESTTSSASQHVRGTPKYMAPEQWSAQPQFASDQYALAVMAYELVTGKPPFQGPPMELLYAHLLEPPQPTSERNPLLSPMVDKVLLRALAKQPEERFPSVATFAQAFSAAFQGVDERTTLRLLAPASATPRTPDAPHTGDIYTTLTISGEEAQSGALRTVALPGGHELPIQVPPGTYHGQELVLFGQGEALEAGRVGDLYLTYSILEAKPQSSFADDDAAEMHRKTQDTQREGEADIAAYPPLPRERSQSRRSLKTVPLLVSALLVILVVSMSILWTTSMINTQHIQATATAQALTAQAYLTSARATSTPTPLPEPPTSVMLSASASGIPPTTQSELTIRSGTIVTLTVIPNHSLLPFQIFTMGIYATDPYGFSELKDCSYPNTATCSYVIAYSSSENNDYTKGQHTFRAFLGNIGGAILENSNSVTITWS